jgi:hypothetical protein
MTSVRLKSEWPLLQSGEAAEFMSNFGVMDPSSARYLYEVTTWGVT